MAYTTQYIGSRYVPTFADPAEWDSTRTYEPLTIVLNEGNSYTSRQFVPVGVALTNTDYWLETGNYNAQVEKYRQEIITEIANREAADTTLQNNIDTLASRAMNYVFENTSLMAAATYVTVGSTVTVERYAANYPYMPALYLISNTQIDNSIKVANGYANLVFLDGIIRPEWFGANHVDDTAAIQAAIDISASIDSPMILFSNTIYYATTLNIPAGINTLTFKGSKTDVSSFRSGIKQLSSATDSLIKISSEADSKNYCYGINFDGIGLAGNYNQYGIEMHGCVRGYISHIQIQAFLVGIYADNLWDYAIEDLNVFNCSTLNDTNSYGVIFTSNSKHQDNCNAIHITNSHFEGNHRHLYLAAASDITITNTKFEHGISSSANRSILVGNAFNHNENVGNCFDNCFFSVGSGSTGDSYVVMSGNDTKIINSSFIGTFSNTRTLVIAGTHCVVDNCSFRTFSTWLDNYAIEFNNAIFSLVTNCTFRALNGSSKINVKANNCAAINNYFDIPTGLAENITVNAGENFTVSNELPLQGSMFNVYGTRVNNLMFKSVNGTVDYTATKKPSPANCFKCTGDTTFTFPPFTLGYMNQIYIIANGHTYKFNGTSYTDNHMFINLAGEWSVF